MLLSKRAEADLQYGGLSVRLERAAGRKPSKIIELANAVEPVQDGRIHIETINGPFLFQLKGTPAECKAGLDLAIARGRHESGTFVRFSQAGANLFA